MEDAPDIGPFDQFYLDAFWDLGTERQLGAFVVGEIPDSAIRAYAREAGLEGENAGAFRLIVRALDVVCLEWMAEELKGA